MISYQEAQQIIQAHKRSFGEQLLKLRDAVGHVLAEDIIADRDWPPFDRVAMDGIAIASGDIQDAKENYIFLKNGIQAAGSPRLTNINAESCVEVMTGAVLPQNCDRVIPYEKVIDLKQSFSVKREDIQGKTNIHYKGSDQSRGDVLINKGKRINLADIAILASVGKSKVLVKSRPRVAVISTGDELVSVDMTPEYYQIRQSNSEFLLADLTEAESFHLRDNKDELIDEISRLKKEFDVLIFSGGVSKGKFDYLPEVFELLGIEKWFHKVAQRPGKPFWFGGDEQCVVFGFPGNPVSTFMCYQVYFKLWNEDAPEIKYARLAKDVVFKPNLTYFIPVRCNEEFWADPLLTNGSGDFSALSKANGIVILEAGKNLYKKGELYQIIEL